jgi:hypothetical protein
MCSVPVLTPVPVPGTGSTGYWIVLGTGLYWVLDCTGYWIVLLLDCTGYWFAKRILVTPATSGPIERGFSQESLIMRPHRTNLSTELLNSYVIEVQ